MKYFTLTLLLCFGACLGKVNETVKNDDPTINGVTVTDAPVTEINSPTEPPTHAPTTPNTTSSSTTTTTAKSTTIPSSPTTTVKPSTTVKPPSPTPNPTIAPNSTTAPVITTAAPHHERKFDGPSFVGGIILALGLVAIGFVAFKFYKARTELNYHTL